MYKYYDAFSSLSNESHWFSFLMKCNMLVWVDYEPNVKISTALIGLKENKKINSL